MKFALAGIVLMLPLASSLAAPSPDPQQPTSLREQRRADLRAAVQAQRQANEAAGRDRHLSPQERVELRQQLKQRGNRPEPGQTSR